MHLVIAGFDDDGVRFLAKAGAEGGTITTTDEQGLTVEIKVGDEFKIKYPI